MTLADKIDHLSHLLEEQEANYIRQNRTLSRDLLIHTALAAMVGYFIVRILDYYYKRPGLRF